MKSFTPMNTEWWKHRAFWKLDARNPRYPTMWSWLVKEACLAQKDGRLELSGEVAQGAEDFAMGYHRASEEEWEKFLSYCIELGILELRGGFYRISIWEEYFFLDSSRSKTADAYRKRAERAEKELKKLSQGKKDKNGHKDSCPDTVPSVQSCPDKSQMSQNILDHIRSDHIRSEDIRSDNSASANAPTENPEASPPETPTEFPATWSADLFSKSSFSSTDLLDEIAPDYRHLAALRDTKPKIFTSQLKTDLLRKLARGAFENHLNDPLVQLIALKMGVNFACSLAVGGYANSESVWPLTLQDAERCVYAAVRICEINREFVRTGKGDFVPPERASNFIPTTLDRQEAELVGAGADTS